MEPRIIKGHLYRCKKSVVGGNHKTYYKEGRVYECECDSFYPDKTWSSVDAKHSCGFITNAFGDTAHAWPYYPSLHLWSNDKWTDFFEDLGEKPHGMIITPYAVGDTVTWFCFDDYEYHKTKILSMEIEVVKDREPIIVYKTRIKFKGRMQDATFTKKNVRAAHKN